MSKKISVLDISIDNFTAKEAMQEALAYMESDLVSVIELVTIESLMELGTEAELKEEIENFDLILAGNKTILEAAEITDHKCLRETEDKTFLKMFLRYLARKHKRVYLLVESEEEGQKMFGHFEEYYRGTQIVGMAKVSAKNRADDMLINAYRQAQDIHRITASQVFHVPFDEVTDLQRRNAKAVNFGIVYGISSFGLSQDLSISRKEAAEYIDQYFLTYPGIKTFLDNTVASAREHGYVETLFGRRRPMPELKSSNYMQRSFGERVAMNAPIQGTAADIIKVAMIGVSRRLKEKQMKSRLVLQVHDELLIETYIPELEQVEEILKEEMERAADLKVPLLVDMHTGNNWYEAK